MTCFFVRKYAGADAGPELVRFDLDPRVERAAQAYRYLFHAGSWVPDTTGVLGELVRRTGQYRQIGENEVMEM